VVRKIEGPDLTIPSPSSYDAPVTMLRFRLPGLVRPLGAWLADLVPSIDRSARKRLFEEGRIRIDGRLLDRPNQDCPAGGLVEIDVVGEVPEALSADRNRHERWAVLVDALPWPGGTLAVGRNVSLDFERIERRGDLALLVLTGAECSASEVCDGLAQASMPVVGDLMRGGLGVAGGVRIEAEVDGEGTSRIAWPSGKIWQGSTNEETGEFAVADFSVSQETARAVAAGHPWVLPDDASDPAGRFRRGSLVRIVDRGDVAIGWAHVEGTTRMAARIWATGELDRRSVPSVESRVARAIARRRSLFVDVQSSGTNAYRLIHGEGDDLPGIFVDCLGPLLRILVSGWSSIEIRERVIAALRVQLPLTPEGTPWSMLELLHLRTRGAHQFERVRWVEGGLDALAESGVDRVGEGYWVEEAGLRYSVDPGWDSTRTPRPGFGLFVDQRDNRERTAKSAGEGGAWLNLFAHTGAFSVSLLAAGAERVVSVDLSRPYLERLEGNLIANQDRGVDPALHRTVRGDVRHYLESLGEGETFRGIVIDPPTAAAAGRRFWSIKQDLEPLLSATIERLEGGGTLLVTQNRSGPGLGLDRVLEALCERVGRPLEQISKAPAGLDHPSRKGFPEGDPFEGWLVTLR
jgi:23S rRNA (cytosine1962-C5)-methyltransferase